MPSISIGDLVLLREEAYQLCLVTNVLAGDEPVYVLDYETSVTRDDIIVLEIDDREVSVTNLCLTQCNRSLAVLAAVGVRVPLSGMCAYLSGICRIVVDRFPKYKERDNFY